MEGQVRAAEPSPNSRFDAAARETGAHAEQVLDRPQAARRMGSWSAFRPRPVVGTAVITVEVSRTPYARFVKPVLDRVGGAFLVVVLLPVLLVIALVVRAQIGRGVIYRQRRAGQGGSEFEVLKFRTMHLDRRADRHPVFQGPDRRTSHKREDDPRHTDVGRLLRRTRLDELPQLWNVVRGEMSLVGPRPELLEVAERYGLRHHPRTAVKPGMTGAWQVSRTASAHLYEGVEVDLAYIRQITFLRDAKILLLTIVTVVRRTGS